MARRMPVAIIAALLLLTACDTLNIGATTTTTSSSSPSTFTPATSTTSSTPVATKPAVDVSGIFGGTLHLSPIPGAPGAEFQATFTVLIDACGTATLTQEPGQTSTGRYEVVGDDPAVLDAVVIGESAEYREGYRVDIVLVEGQAQIAGFGVGGGHGFGSIPLTEFVTDTLDFLAGARANGIGSTPSAADVPGSADFGWVNTVQGTLARTGDAPACN